MASPLWRWFYKEDEKYSAGNKTHPLARCKACVQKFQQELVVEETENLAQGTLPARSSDVQILSKGAYLFGHPSLGVS